MLKKTYSLIGLMFLFVFAVLMAISSMSVVSADLDPTPGPNRYSMVEINNSEYGWWLVYWSNNLVACSFTIDSEDKPTGSDILKSCGQEIFNKWSATQVCTAGKPGSTCTGMYLHSLGTQLVKYHVEQELPSAKIWLSVSGCDLELGSNKCTGTPILVFTGEEPVPDQEIVKIQGSINGVNFSCQNTRCEVPIPVTSESGVPVTFWADSSYGDSSVVYYAKVRAFPIEAANTSKVSSGISSQYTLDILSSQWTGFKGPSCSLTWMSFPPVSGFPKWLDTPVDSTKLGSSFSLQYLAAELIRHGSVNASTCPNGGYETSITANQCGLEIAQSAVYSWQNQFDGEIIKNAEDLDIPGQLIKNMFIQESQLWPGIYRPKGEIGFGQLTENGADTVLRWNTPFFSLFCPQVYSKRTCELGYSNLTKIQQSVLKGALLTKVDASCPGCQSGVDILKAQQSINVFAHSIVGNCNQVNQLFQNLTGEDAGNLSTYEDLWRFTLVNYNAGPGCLYTALSRTWEAKDSLDWAHVAANLDPACQGAIDYVDQVSEGKTQDITFSTTDPIADVTQTQIPSVTITATATP